MGSRGRSIRLRIYFLVAIPLLTMLGLFGYVTYTSVTNWLNLDRAPQLIKATSVPLTNFVSILQAERRAAVVYLSQPDAANLQAYQKAVGTTQAGEAQLQTVIQSPATTSNATADETAAIQKMVGDVLALSGVRSKVSGKAIPAFDAFTAYTSVITDQDIVLDSEASSMTETTTSSEGMGLISAINAREDVSEQDALLAGALAAGTISSQDRVAFGLAGGRLQDDTALFQKLLSPAELAEYNTTFNSQVPAKLPADLTQVQEGVESGVSLTDLEFAGLSPAGWEQLTGAWQKANYNATLSAANTSLSVDQGMAISAKRRVIYTGGVGVVGLLLTLLVTGLLGRSINRRLTVLRRSAMTLAQEQLPSVVTRLRRGEAVDVAAEAPPLRVGGDEIGQVGEAIDAVRQSAIRSAVDEARVRQGVNDMFRNLARRNQSLLQRQLGVIDDMERKAQDPDVLEDLFKMDHLTTRMRRHAEGLIILSGSPPGRSWSAPVKLIDVMRGAVAEVEDYARVTVATQSRAALAGSAVTDVIHLLAELIENATTLSPPFTQVRVGGENVANGFAIEIEDRGLGMTPQRLDELNDRLANPPDINPANTEQLGLFVVGQLARRHGIGVALRPSPYGGTTAVVLIPRGLIDEGPAAIAAGPGLAGANGRANGYAAGYQDAGAFDDVPGAGGAGARWQNGSGSATVPPAPAAGPNGWSGSDDWRGEDDWPEPNGWPATNGGWPASNGWAASGSDGAAYPGPATSGAGYPAPPMTPPVTYDDANPPIRITGDLRQPGMAPGGGDSPGAAEPGPRRGGRHGMEEVPVVTGVPVTRPMASPAAPFDVFTPLRRSESDIIPPVAPAELPDAPYAQAYPDFGGSPADSGYGNFSDGGNNGSAEGGYQSGNSAVGEDQNGLPRRVRQANLAPQLRKSAAAGSAGETGVPPATAASLTDMRNTLSAMQRGWQQGRSQSQQDTEGQS